MNGCIQENDLPWFCIDGFDISMKINQNKKWDTSIFYSNKDAKSELMRAPAWIEGIRTYIDMLYTAIQLLLKAINICIDVSNINLINFE